MIVMETHRIVREGKVVGVMRVYLEISGDPSTLYNIIGVSIDGSGIGTLPTPDEIVEGNDM
jgi:hypothetical protein